MFVFHFITTYNADFWITLNKLANTGCILPNDLQLATYIHEIKDIYLDFTTSQQLAFRDYVPDISVVIAELEDEPYTPNEPTVLFTCFSNASQRKSYDRENRNMRDWGCGSYVNN